MDGEIPKCQCNEKPMIYITDTGQQVVGSDDEGNSWARSIRLYQCEDCKTIQVS